MDDDFEIEIQDEGPEEPSGVQLPVNFLQFGEIESDDVKVYIKQDVYKALEKLSRSDTSKELGSILIGEHREELGKTHVIISDYIEAKYTDASASTLTFTHETWNYIHSEQERLYPDKKIIGWQHTHPNYGIFLSNYDMFIQENFFDLPFQIAYVIDPIQDLRGFFQWKNGKVEKLRGYYIYDDIGKPIELEQPESKKAAPSKSSKGSKAATAAIAVLCAATVFLSCFAISLNRKYSEQSKKQDEMTDELARRDEIISEQADTIEKLQNENAAGAAETSEALTADELTGMLESGELKLQNSGRILEKLKSAEADGKSFYVYSVDSGDTLTKICAEHGLDYKADLAAVIDINCIEDANLIYRGQKLLLPAK